MLVKDKRGIREAEKGRWTREKERERVRRSSLNAKVRLGREGGGVETGEDWRTGVSERAVAKIETNERRKENKKEKEQVTRLVVEFVQGFEERKRSGN